ncbi:MAG: M6 family metalloprotease domain-containing protein [Elusimicrobia bacterium]|nr:M6 family metalloprotease domain-containing protein [Candidatus Liberimonas magnetica]
MKNRIWSIVLSCWFLLIFKLPLFAVIHINGTDTGPKEYTRPAKKYDEQTLIKMGYAPEKVMGVVAPATGTKKIAVILVQFTISGSNTSGQNTLTSGDIVGFNNTLDYLKNFYNEASCGKLVLDITYFYNNGTASVLTGNETPYKLSSSMASYGADTEASLSQLILDSLNMVNPSALNSSLYDAVIVAHAGYGNESTSNAGDIWSAAVGPFINSSGNQVSANGFTDGTNIPARESNASPIGVTCHEFGHILGLFDLYSTTDSRSRVGKWCLMDYGPWVNNGYTPTHPSVWCKKYLGWVNPIKITNDETISAILPVQISSTTSYQVPILGSTQEYFLICHSTASTYDPNTPGGGIMIMHIDEGIIDGSSFIDRMANNSLNNYSHNTVGIEPAGNSDPSNPPYGNPNDLWPGIKKTFASPDSDSYSGKVSNITISNISFSGNKAGFVTTNLSMTDVASIQSIVNYPNPCGQGYFHPRKNTGVITTFALKLSKVTDNIGLSIYNLAGEKIIDVAGNNFQFKVTQSSDYKIVYEYDWNGKNQNFENVAPGIYFYKFNVGNETKTGKMAVAR